MEMNKMIGYAIGITFSLIIVAVLLPLGLTTFFNANWSSITGLDASVATMITVLIPIMIVLGIVLLFMPKIRGKMGGD